MKRYFSLVLVFVFLVSSGFAQQTQFKSEMLKMGWTFIAPTILKKIENPLTKEIVHKTVPELIDKNVKGAVFETTDAIYRVKGIKVLNKEYLAFLETRISAALRSIQDKDYVTAVNEIIDAVLVSDTYIKKGILNDVYATTEHPDKNNENLIDIKDVQEKLYLADDNTHLFFVPDGKLSLINKAEQEKTFEVMTETGLTYNLLVGAEKSEVMEGINIQLFKEDKVISEAFKEGMEEAFVEDFGPGQIMSSVIDEKNNIEYLKYTFQYTDKDTYKSSTAEMYISFYNSTMYMITFYSESEVFTQTRKLFDNLMNNFYIIGYDNISDAGTAKEDCEIQQTGTLRIFNNSQNPYDIYFNGQYILRLSGKTVSEPIIVPEGNNHELYTKQVSGYMMYPTEKTASLNVIRCSEYEWQIP